VLQENRMQVATQYLKMTPNGRERLCQQWICRARRSTILMCMKMMI